MSEVQGENNAEGKLGNPLKEGFTEAVDWNRELNRILRLYNRRISAQNLSLPEAFRRAFTAITALKDAEVERVREELSNG